MLKKVTIVVLLSVLIVLSFGVATVDAAPQHQAAGFFYKVRPGDTLYSIAWRFGSTVWAIARANGLSNPSLIFAGQVLFIPGRVPAPAPPAPPAPIVYPGQVIHIVRWGETLSSISRLYGVSIWAIAQANGIANPSQIYAGQRLIIPARTPIAQPTVYPLPWWGGYGYGTPAVW